MRVVNEQSFSYLRQRSVCGVEKRVRTHIVHRSDPFPFQYSPKSFRNVQMWGIGRQIEKEKTSFLPDRSHLSHFMISVYGCIVKYNKRFLTHTERECIEKTDNLVRGNTFRRGETLIMVFAVNHAKDVEPCCSLGWDAYLLSGQLPAVGNVSLGTDMALISIVEGNTSLAFPLFKFLQLLVLVIIELRRGGSPWAFPYTLISCANADKKRLNVRSLASFPVASCQEALALLTLCLSCSMAARTASSSEQSIIGFRPRPGRVCRPEIPSDWKRFTQALTDTKLISVCSPTWAEDRPSDLRRTARQRMRKQWLVPLRKPFSSCTRWAVGNVSFFIFPIANPIYYNRTQSKTKYFI